MTTTYEATTVEAIDPADIDRTYRGKTGCACGCGGDYFDAVNAEHAAQITKHSKYIFSGIKNKKEGIEFFGCGVELASPSYTTVTRIYFKDGIEYYTLSYGRIERRVKIEKAN
jgi:hypothetical protein